MSVISALNKTLAVPGLCWGLWGEKTTRVHAHAPFLWPPQLTKEQSVTSTAHFPKSSSVWRNLHHDLQQHAPAMGSLCPHDLLETGQLKVAHSYPLHHKSKTLTEGEVAEVCPHRVHTQELLEWHSQQQGQEQPLGMSSTFLPQPLQAAVTFWTTPGNSTWPSGFVEGVDLVHWLLYAK